METETGIGRAYEATRSCWNEKTACTERRQWYDERALVEACDTISNTTTWANDAKGQLIFCLEFQLVCRWEVEKVCRCWFISLNTLVWDKEMWWVEHSQFWFKLFKVGVSMTSPFAESNYDLNSRFCLKGQDHGIRLCVGLELALRSACFCLGVTNAIYVK